MFCRLTLVFLFSIRSSLQQCNEVETTVDFNTSPEYYNGVEPNLTGCNDDGSMCIGGILNDADIGPIHDIDATDPNSIQRFYVWQVDSIFQVFLRYHSIGRQFFNFSHVTIYALADSLASIGIPVAPIVTAYGVDTTVRVTMVDICTYYTASEKTIIKIIQTLPSTIEVRRVDIQFRDLGVRWLFISEIELCQGSPESSLKCVASTSVSASNTMSVPMSTQNDMLRMPQPSSTTVQDQTTENISRAPISSPEIMLITSSAVLSYTKNQPVPTLILFPSITLSSPPPTGLTVIPDLNQPNSVSLSCSVNSGKYQYHWHWWKNGQLLSNNNVITNNNNTQSTTLLIINLQHSDAGDYMCRVEYAECSNDAHHKEAIGNIKLSLPVVVIVNEPEYTECGSHVAIMCEVFGYPHNSFLPVWTFGEQIIQDDDRHTVTVTRSNLLRDSSVSMEQRVISQLMIENITKDDAGVYKCSVEGNSTSGTIIHSSIANDEDSIATDSNNMGYDCDALIGTGVVLAVASVVSIAVNVLMAICVYHIQKNLKNNSKSSENSINLPPVQEDTYQYIMDDGNNIMMIHTQNQAYGQCEQMQEMNPYQRTSTTSSHYYY